MVPEPFRQRGDLFAEGQLLFPLTAVIVIIFIVIFVIRADFRLKAVENDADDSRLDIIELGLGPLQGAPGDLADLINDDNPVGLGSPYRGIGGRQDGRGIDDHEIIFFMRLIDDVGINPRAHQFCRVGSDRSAGHDVEVVKTGGDHELFHRHLARHEVRDGTHHIPPPVIAEDDVRQTRQRRDAENLGDHRSAKIAVDQEDLVARLGHCNGQVGGYGGLPFLGRGTGEDDRLGVLFEFDKVDVGAQGAVTLRRGGLGGEVGDQPADSP
jgi:hypothetical protein